MLKINEKNISKEDFAKKYGIVKDKFGDYVSESKGIQILFEDYICTYITEENDVDLDLLFDMIKNGDVIKG